MNLVDQIKNDMRKAMKAHNTQKVTTLRGIMSAFTDELLVQKKKPTDTLDDTGALAVIKRAAKQRKDSIEQFTTGGRPELAQKEEIELKMIEAYLPETAPKEEIEKVVLAKIAELNISDKSQIGQLIGSVMKEFGGNADGNDVKEIVAKHL